jgi:hypothetical protein
VRRAVLLAALLAGCNTEVDLTLTFDANTVLETDLDRLRLLEITVDGAEQAHKLVALENPLRSHSIVYLPRAHAGTLTFLAGASDPGTAGEGWFAAGTASVDLSDGHPASATLTLFGPGGPGPVDGGTFEGDLSGFGQTDGGGDDGGVPDDLSTSDGPPPDLLVVKHCANPVVYLCDHFDGTALDPQWGVAGDVTLDTSEGHTANGSAKARTANAPGSQFAFLLPDTSVQQQLDNIWIRVFVHAGTTNPLYDVNLLEANDSSGNGYSLLVNTMGKLVLEKIAPGGNMTVLKTTTVPMPQTYECITFAIDRANNTFEIFHNDLSIGSVALAGIGPIQSFAIGNAPVASPVTTGYLVHYDDVLVDDQPLNCSQ